MSRRMILILAGVSAGGGLVARSQTPQTAFRGHADPVYAAALSPDGKTAATGSFDKTIKLWDAATGKELRTLGGATGHQSLVLTVAFAPDGSRLATGGADNLLKIWDVPLAKPVAESKFGPGPVVVAASADGKLHAAGGADGKIRVILPDGKPPLELVGHAGGISALAFAGSSSLLSAGVDGTLRQWALPAGTPGPVIGVGPADVILPHPGTNTIITAAKGVMKFWPAQPVVAKPLPAGPVTVATTDGTFAALAGADANVRWVNTTTGQVVSTLPASPTGTTALALAGGNTILAGGADGSLRVWGTDGKPRGTFAAHIGAVRLVAAGANGQTLTAGDDGFVRTWAIPPAVAAKPLVHADKVLAAVAHPDGKRLVTGAADKLVRVWKDGVVSHQAGPHDAAVTAVVVAGEFAYSADAGGGLRGWNLATKQPAGVLPGLKQPVTHLAVSADGKHLAAADAAGVAVWKLPLTEKQPTPVFAPLPAKGVVSLDAVAGQTAFQVATAAGVTAFDKATGKPVGTVDPQTGVTAFAKTATKSVVATAGKLVVRGADAKPLREIVLTGKADFVAISPTGTRVAAVVAGAVLAFDADTGVLLQTLGTQAGPVRTLGFLSDGKTAFAGGDDKAITFFDIAVTQAFVAHPGGVTAGAVLPNGQILTTGADKTVKVWDAAGKPLRTLGTFSAKTLGVSRDGALAVAAADTAVKVWQTADGKELPFPALDFVPTALAVSADKKLLFVGHPEKHARVYDLATGELVQFFPTAAAVTGLAAHPSLPACLVAAADKSAAVHTVAFLRSTKPAEGFRVGPVAVPNSNSIMTAGDGNTVTLWNAGNGQKERSFDATSPVTAMAYAKNGQTLAVAGGAAPTVQFFGGGNGTPFATLSLPAAARDLSFHPNGLLLATALADDTVTVFKANAVPGQAPPPDFGAKVQAFAHPAAVSHAAFLGDGGTLATAAADGGFRTWKFASDQPAFSINLPNLVDGVAFDPTGKLLAAACHDGTVRTYDPIKGTAVKVINAHTTPAVNPVYVVAWTPDGKTLISASFDKSIKFWDATAGTLVREIKPGTETPPTPGHTDQVFCLAVSPDGKTLASGSSDKSVKLWDIATGNYVRGFANPGLTPPPAGQPKPTHPGFVHAVRFTPDGKQLVSAGTAPRNGGYLAVWTVADGGFVAGGEQPHGAIYSLTLTADGTSALLGCGPRQRGQTESDAVLVKLPGK